MGEIELERFGWRIKQMGVSRLSLLSFGLMKVQFAGKISRTCARRRFAPSLRVAHSNLFLALYSCPRSTRFARPSAKHVDANRRINSERLPTVAKIVKELELRVRSLDPLRRYFLGRNINPAIGPSAASLLVEHVANNTCSFVPELPVIIR